jgi:hypothetical protein
MFKKAYILILFISLAFSPASVFAIFTPNDDLFLKQDYLQKVNAQKAWDLATGSGITIAVLDSGIDINHPDLKDNIWVNPREIPRDNIDNDNNGYIDDVRGWDFVDHDNNPSPDFYKNCLIDKTCSEVGLYHGTIIAGVAAARGNNGEGIIGLAHEAKIMPIKVLDDDGTGNMRSVIEGINYAINRNVDIINLSLVGVNKSELLDSFLKKAHDKGIVIVAASGNDNDEYGGFDLNKDPLYPVCDNSLDNIVIGVGALSNDGDKSNISNYGSTCIDISTVGENFYSTIFYNSNNELFKDAYSGWWSGTSVATALVSGTAALVKSVNPKITNREIEKIIINNSSPFDNLDPRYEGEMGSGSLDAFLAVKFLADQTEVAPQEEIIVDKNYLMASPKSNMEPAISFYNLTNNNFYIRDMLAYGKNFRGGVNSSSGDLTGNGQSEIVTGTGVTGGPQVRVFDQLGRVVSQFFAYDKNFRGGVNVAVGQIIGNSSSEIVTGIGPGEKPYVRVFDAYGTLIFEFLAYGENFRGGVKVSTGDVDGDGIDEIITGAGEGGGPHIRIFDRFGRVKSNFFAYDRDFRLGVNVTVGDVDGNGIDEIITTLGNGGGSEVRVFDIAGKVKSSFFAYEEGLISEVELATGDINNDDKDEIIVSPGVSGSSMVKMFSQDGDLLDSLNIFNKDFQEGINIAIIKAE